LAEAEALQTMINPRTLLEMAVQAAARQAALNLQMEALAEQVDMAAAREALGPPDKEMTGHGGYTLGIQAVVVARAQRVLLILPTAARVLLTRF